MTGKVLDNAATGILVLILPIALAIVVVFTAWPYLLLLLGLIVAWQIWQSYRWQQLSQQVNPYFNELIKENQGCLTSLDLSLKTNMTARAAKSFLAKKAEEYGAQRREFEGKGVVYYFLTASALGSIFDDSEPISARESPELDRETLPQLATPAPAVELQPQGLSLKAIAQMLEMDSEESPEEASEPQEEQVAKGEALLAEKAPQQVSTVVSEQPESASASEQAHLTPLLQADLAKRLDLHSNTVGKRKSDSDFPQWSQSKDPEGIAWKYLPKTKKFVPVELEE